jgi:hypothetical protein
VTVRLGALAAVLGLAALPAGAAAGMPPRMEAVGGTAPAIPGARYAGALAADVPLDLTVVLKPRDEAGLTSFVEAVSSPGSPSYGHYLAPGEFGPAFGATPHTIAAVTAALRSAGLRPGAASSDGLTIPVSGRAAVVAAALHVDFARYSLPGGRGGFANTSAPELPADVAGAVRDVVGLQTLSRPQALGLTTATRASGSPAVVPGLAPGASTTPAAAPQTLPDAIGPTPCAAASGEAAVQRAYTIDQLAEGYDLDPFYGAGDLGAGTTIGIYELEPDLPSDIAAFGSCFGAGGVVDEIPVDGGPGAGAGSGEAAIDIETVLGVAPQSRIEVFAGPTTGSGPLDIYVAMADQDTSQVNTTSWGLCEQDMLLGDPNSIADETPVFQQMAAQGQTLYAATGDSGSEGCAGDAGTPFKRSLAVNDPASQTQVTGVGGTSLVAAYTAGGRPAAVDATPLVVPPFQTVWNESAASAGAGGGGISTVHGMPSYQSGAPAGLGVVNASSSGAPCRAPAGGLCRELPDVSAAADPVGGSEVYCTDDGTPNTLCQGGNPAGSRWEAVGGTSAAAPFWAGMTALINADSADGCAVPATFGMVNPLLYAIAGGSAYAGALTDIVPSATPGVPADNDYGGLDGGLYPVGVGYDMATGLGTPLAGGPGGLAHQLCALRAPVTQAPTLSSLSPAGGPASAGTAVTVDGASFVPGASVTVGGTAATGVQVLSFNQLTAVMPAGSGVEQVTVTTAHGTSGPLPYTYPTPPGPAAVPTPAPSTTPRPGSVPGASAPVPATPARRGPRAAALLLSCTRAKLAITDVVVNGSDVGISGAAPASLAGRRVRILFGAHATQVAVATVASDGGFTAAAPLPAVSALTGASARYEAVLGSLRSAALPLTRRVILEPPREIGGKVVLTGRVTGPLASPLAPVTIRQSTSCSAGIDVASVRPSASGRFTVRLTPPPGVLAALYRLGTRVRQTARSRVSVAAGSLLESVGLS